MTKKVGKARASARRHKNKPRSTRNRQEVSGWSEQNFRGLTPEQHAANNAWFAKVSWATADGGIVFVPSLGKKFQVKHQKNGKQN